MAKVTIGDITGTSELEIDNKRSFAGGAGLKSLISPGLCTKMHTGHVRVPPGQLMPVVFE
jgi:hypothetical protein